MSDMGPIVQTLNHARQNFRETSVYVPITATGLIYLILGAALIFLIICYNITYADATRAEGRLEYDIKTASIGAPRQGVISDIYVSKGTFVERGTPLFRIALNQGISSASDGFQRRTELLDVRKAALTEQAQLRESTAASETENLRARIDAITDVIARLEESRALVVEEITRNRDNLAERTAQVADGIMTQNAVEDLSRRIFSLIQTISDLDAQIAQTRLNLIETEGSLASMAIETRLSVLADEAEISEIDERGLSLREEVETTIFATTDGYVLHILEDLGNTVRPDGTAVVELSDRRNTPAIRAFIYVGSDSILDVSVGDSVKLELDSVSVTRAGTVAAEVVEVSGTPLSAAEIRELDLDPGIYYQVAAQPDLDRLAEVMDLENFPAGVGLSANIQGAERSLLSIFIDPILKARETILN